MEGRKDVMSWVWKGFEKCQTLFDVFGGEE